MKPLKGSKTEINLLKAFAGESQARTRYDFFASQAKKDGLVDKNVKLKGRVNSYYAKDEAERMA